MGNTSSNPYPYASAHPHVAAPALQAHLDLLEAYAQLHAQRGAKHLLRLQQLLLKQQHLQLPVIGRRIYADAAGAACICVPARDAGGRMAVAKGALAAWLSLQLLHTRPVLGVDLLAPDSLLRFILIIIRRGYRRPLVGAVAAAGAGYLSTFGSSGCDMGQFIDPQCIAFDGLGNVAIGCKYRVQIFRYSDWAPVLSFGSRGSGHGMFLKPTGITFDRLGHVIVVDDVNCNVQVFRSSDGRHVRSFSSKGSGLKQLKEPTGVCCDGRGNIVVNDNVNGSLEVFRLSDGAHMRSIETRSGMPFNQYTMDLPGSGDVTFDADGNLVVCSSRSNRIVVLEYISGRLLRSIIHNCNFPRGIALDSAGHIVITCHHSVQILRYSDGGRVRTICSASKHPHSTNNLIRFIEGRATGEFNKPSGVAIDGDGRILVCDSLNHRVQVLQ